MQAPKTEHDPAVLIGLLEALAELDRAHVWLWANVIDTGDSRYRLSTEEVWEKYRRWGPRDPMSEAHFIFHAETLGLQYDPVDECFLGVMWRTQEPPTNGLTKAEQKEMNTLSARYKIDVANGSWNAAYNRMTEMQALRKAATKRISKKCWEKRKGPQ